MKHKPFQSIYRPDFEVVEQRLGNQRLYPHTEQLPLLLRALNLEFYGALPNYIARVDKRGDGFHKYLLKSATLMFCAAFNRARGDELRLFNLPTPELVYKITLMQQVSEQHPLGLFHRFRFYGSDGFFPEIRLSGRRLAFADHVLQRFSTRVPNNVGEDLAIFFADIFHHADVQHVRRQKPGFHGAPHGFAAGISLQGNGRRLFCAHLPDRQ